MNGGLVGFVDPHDPTGAEEAILSLCFHPLYSMVLQLYMHPSLQILFQSESSLMPIALRSIPASLLHFCILALIRLSRVANHSNPSGILRSGGTFAPLQAVPLHFV
jgi:hypothetical protein